MKITYYLYNAFIIEWDDKKIAIDPGALFAYWFSFASLIPKEEWKDITHIFVTHGDPDHYVYVDKVMEASGAPVIFNKTMVKEVDGEPFMHFDPPQASPEIPLNRAILTHLSAAPATD